MACLLHVVVQGPGSFRGPVNVSPWIRLRSYGASKKLTDLGNSLALGLHTWSKQYLSAVHLLTCIACSEWGTCLTPSKFGILRVNGPWMKTFNKFLSKICVSTTIYVPWLNLAKISRWEVAEKSFRIADKKNPASGTLLSPPISPQLNRSRPKFRERCQPLTCACVPTLVRIGCGLLDLFRKESKKVKTI